VTSSGNMHVPDQFGALVYLAIPWLVLAVLFHPGKLLSSSPLSPARLLQPAHPSSLPPSLQA